MITHCELWPDLPSTARLFESRLHELEQTRRTTIPVGHSMLSEALVVRWFWRAFLARQNQWCPLVFDTEGTSNEARVPWPHIMRVVPLGTPIPEGSDDLWVSLHDAPFEVSPQWASHAQAVDRWHDVASDPDLAAVRAHVLSACQQGGPMHVQAERTTGARELVYWAHAMLDERPISDVSYDASLTPGQWVLAPELDALTPSQQETLRHALARHRPPPRVHRDERIGPRPLRSELESLIGQSKVYTQTLHMLERLAQSDLTLLMLGEPGVGKGLMAQVAHELSGRTGDFVTLDVGALTPSLLESALFGHVKGAFTGAANARKGAFRQAEQGTLFLDEVGNLEPELQIKFLRALQERQVLPVGADKPVDVDVRVIAASNADLDAMVRQGTFRLDLLGRLNAATLHVPPLRDRGKDLDLIARHVLGVQDSLEPWCDEDARALLHAYHWPGNVRELANIVRYAQVMSASMLIKPEHLGPLAPQDNRRVPVVMIGEKPLEDQVLGASTRTLSSVSVHMPALRERSVAARLHHVLLKLPAGRCTPAALRALSRHVWWGNHAAMDVVIGRIMADDVAPMTLERLNTLCPEVIQADYLGPLVMILNPMVRRGGQIDGFRQSFREPALLLGRITHTHELRVMAQRGDAKARQWLTYIERDMTPPVCVPLHLSRLSRAHLMIHRHTDALRIARLPHTTMAVRLRTALTPSFEGLEPGQEVDAGAWAEVHFCDRRGTTLMTLLLCCDTHAQEDYLSHMSISTREPDVKSLAPPTLLGTATPQRGGVSMWCLNPSEVDMLVDMVSTYQSGSFKRHMEAIAREYVTRPGAHTLCAFIHNVPRLSQYLVRLIQQDDNGALREALLERFASTPELQASIVLFPKSIQMYLNER